MSQISDVPETVQRADAALRQIGTDAEGVALSLLLNEENTDPVVSLKKRAGLEGDAVERLLIWHASQRALPQVAALPIDKAVSKRLEQDLRQLHAWKDSLEAGSYHYNRAAKIATLRRFPVGPMEWEVSGIPRSFFLQAAFPANLRLMAFVASRLRGLGPCFFMHVAPAPRSRALTVPKEVLRSYYAMVRSMEQQPGMRALLACAWFHDPAALKDYPHLEVLNSPYLEHGGLITTLGPAPAESGVMTGNAQRSADYLAGKVAYKYGLAIWPRDAAIRWANAHPEFGV